MCVPASFLSFWPLRTCIDFRIHRNQIKCYLVLECLSSQWKCRPEMDLLNNTGFRMSLSNFNIQPAICGWARAYLKDRHPVLIKRFKMRDNLLHSLTVECSLFSGLNLSSYNFQQLDFIFLFARLYFFVCLF